MALGRLDNSDVVFDLYHESSKFVPPSSFGLLIMSKCTEMARQPSHWVNLNGSNLRRGERHPGKAEGREGPSQHPHLKLFQILPLIPTSPFLLPNSSSIQSPNTTRESRQQGRTVFNLTKGWELTPLYLNLN